MRIKNNQGIFLNKNKNGSSAFVLHITACLARSLYTVTCSFSTDLNIYAMVAGIPHGILVVFGMCHVECNCIN